MSISYWMSAVVAAVLPCPISSASSSTVSMPSPREPVRYERARDAAADDGDVAAQVAVEAGDMWQGGR